MNLLPSHSAMMLNLTALLRILEQGASQATGLCHAVAEHLVLSCLIDEDVLEHVKVHHSPRVVDLDAWSLVRCS